MNFNTLTSVYFRLDPFFQFANWKTFVFSFIFVLISYKSVSNVFADDSIKNENSFDTVIRNKSLREVTYGTALILDAPSYITVSNSVDSTL